MDRREHGYLALTAASAGIRYLYYTVTFTFYVWVLVGVDAFTGTYEQLRQLLSLLPAGTLAAVWVSAVGFVLWSVGAGLIQAWVIRRGLRRWPVDPIVRTSPPPTEQAVTSSSRWDPRLVTVAAGVTMAAALATTNPLVLAGVAAWLALLWLLARPGWRALAGGLALAAPLTVSTPLFGLVGGIGTALALTRAARVALLVLTAVWLRAVAGADGLREVTLRVVHRLSRIRTLALTAHVLGASAGAADYAGASRRLGRQLRTARKRPAPSSTACWTGSAANPTHPPRSSSSATADSVSQVVNGPAAADDPATHPVRRRAQPPGRLRARTLLPQLALLLGGEAGLFVSYAVLDSAAHWTPHFLVALTTAVIWLSGYLLILAQPAPGQLLAILVLHLFAIVPDLLLFAGIAHQGWMNIFLHHLRVDERPGAISSGLVLALIAIGVYMLLLGCWLRARGIEVGRGMCPGVGIGGMAVVRAQRDPAVGLLAHRHRGARADGPPVVLLHGLGATAAVWGGVAERLDEVGVPTLSVDLLGHGDSLSLGSRFTLADQVRSVGRLLHAHHLGPVALVGHSWGAAVAVAVARELPDRVEQLLLVAPPAFADPGLAHRRLGARSWFDRRTVAGAPESHVACGMMCLMRRPLGDLVALVRPDLDPAVARGAFAHTYPAFRTGLDALLAPDSVLVRGLREPTHRTALLLGTDDVRVHPGDIAALGPGAAVDVAHVPGGHRLPIAAPELVADFLLARLDR